ncbi:MAG: SAM-dependent methyltransferase [Candidatus Hadarchaeota archaeon]
MLLVIEHLEPKLSEWLYIEYAHSSKIAGRRRLIITNIKKQAELKKLAKVAQVERRRVVDIFDQRELVVLDPLARRSLSPKDLNGKKAVVVGGILGNDPPLGRTRELLARHLSSATTRNIGKQQFSIDGAVYMAKKISEGMSLKDVPVQQGLEIKISRYYSNFLPYAFPLNGRPVISKRLVEYLKKH